MRLEPLADGGLMLLGLGEMLPEDLGEVRIAVFMIEVIEDIDHQ